MSATEAVTEPAAPARSAPVRGQAVRFIEIDGMRGLGATLVILGHINYQRLFWVWVFMDMFFVVSSFLITRIVMRQVTGMKGLLAFWGRRVERIWPLYLLTVWALLVLTLAINWISTGRQFDISLFWRFFTFSQFSDYLFDSVSDEPYPYFTGHLWSLSVEEQFYILLPILLLLLRNTPRWLWMTVLLAAIPFAVWQRALHPYTVIITSHIDAFALGSLMAIGLEWMQDNRKLANRALWVGFIVGLVGFLPYVVEGYQAWILRGEERHYEAWPATAGILMASCWIALLAINRGASWLKLLCWQPLVYAGVISYALYLAHYPVVRFMPKLAPALAAKLGLPPLPGPVEAALTITICFLLGHVLYKFIDQRLQTRKAAPAPHKSSHP